MIKLQGVDKKLNGFALQNVTVELPEGYIMGLIGENGAGKTTLLKLLLGLYRQDAGEIFIDGMTYAKDEKKIRNEVGWVLAEDVFSKEMKLSDQARMYGKYYEKYDNKLFTEYCRRFQLEEEEKYKRLSKGEKLKFQFAFAMAHEPRLLLLDEPTANFDPEFREEFLKIITDFVADGKHSVLLATHMTEELDRIADYVTFLHKGRVKFSVSRDELERKYRLVSGEDYLINLIKKDRVIYAQKGKYSTTALVEHNKNAFYSKELEISVPDIETIMYYMMKGEKNGGKRNDWHGIK